MSTNVDRLVQDFYVKADNSKQLLQRMLETISAGKAPEKGSVDELYASIHVLCEKYDMVRQFASEYAAEDEMPPEGSPVNDYKEAVANSVLAMRRKLLNDVKDNLASFLAVRSLAGPFTAALWPYQKQAEVLLKQIRTDDTMDIETVRQETVGPEAFMRALSCPDFDTEENIEILERLTGLYPPRVQIGVSTQKYFIDQEILARSANLPDVPMEDGVKRKEEAEKEATEKENMKKEVSGGVLAADTAALEEVSVENGAFQEAEGHENASESDFILRLKENHVFLPESYHYGILSAEINQTAEEKKISASIFLNEMRKGYEKAQKAIIKEIEKRSYITRELLVDIKGHPGMQILSGLEYLLKKGYLHKYRLVPGGEFYCASSRLRKALTFKEGCKYAGIRQHALEDFGDEIEGAASSVAARVAFTKLNNANIRRYVDKAVSGYKEHSSICTNAFVDCVYLADDPSDCELSFGAFWDTPEECDDMLETVKNFLSSCEGVSRLTAAGVDFEKARALLHTVLEFLDCDFIGTEMYVYSLADDAFQKDSEDSFADAGIDSPEEKSGTAVTEETTAGEAVEEEAVTAEADVLESEIREPFAMEEKAGSESEEITDTIYKMIIAEKHYAAAAYAKVCAMGRKLGEMSYERLAYALNDPMAHCTYLTGNVFNLIGQDNPFEEALVIAIAVRTFCSNQVKYDYDIKPFYDGIKDYAPLDDFPALREVLYSLMKFKNEQKEGLYAFVGCHSKSQADLEKEILVLKREAASFYDNYVVGHKKERASLKRFVETKKLMFSAKSEIGEYIKSVADGDKELMPFVSGFLQEHFFREDSVISESSVDSDMLWGYIVGFWEAAGGNMMYRRHEDLKSHLRSNITSVTTKAVQILARWCVLVEQANKRTEEEGMLAYKKIRRPLQENIAQALKEVAEGFRAEGRSLEEKAGLRVLAQTLEELQSRVGGVADERDGRYFYVPFLLTGDVMLDENFMPDLDVRSSAVKALQPERRILDHVRAVKEAKATYRGRLADILDGQRDDYGAARLIVEYLSYKEPDEDFHEISEKIEAGESYAKETAKLRKDDFVGELELAQSYGQIDNSVEDQKEKILQVIDGWHEWSGNSSNYGFFGKVMDGYLAEIRESAKCREKDLLEQLKGFKEAEIPGISNEAKGKRAAKINAMIEKQNYTVAEDLLARAAILEDEHEGLVDEGFLKDFLDNYEDYYQPVATHQDNFAKLVSSRTRNKEERGAKRLAENWLPGGSKLGEARLMNLLNCLGFRVGSVEAQEPRGKFESFIVKTVTAQGEQRDNYPHPIAAFGSGAISNGFRVVCITGRYEAGSLIDVMKQIGNAKHTLILVDHALAKAERRRLARKTKNELGDKLFAVIDRTVMMFLVRNFDETKIHRMLISLIVPFGYYQPYVWESANVMPPEIFMGRKNELERIKSPTGVNIVYGGRQLGKSALLKKAKEDIDRDENGDRAVYIEIKGLSYQEVARKIGHELYDHGILEEDADITDWDVLARAIKRRLQEGEKEKQIPYLLLLLDEADAFIESCEAVNYKPFDTLKEIQGIGAGRFKFVIAGLRNIVRFKREAALGNNSVLTHLEPMTVKPFNTSEARELMEVPLHYLGLRFPKEKESLVTLILATTNYFPGLIQMYCAKLLEAMRNKDYAGYNEVDTPIYEVSEEHIKKVLADPEFTQQIREKYIITLKLDEDNYYYLIALLMAYLYHTDRYNEGYSASDIQKAGKELGIAKVTVLDTVKLTAFMEELRELNVLRSTDETHYLFTRFNFFQMMGTSTEIEDKLVEYMED